MMGNFNRFPQPGMMGPNATNFNNYGYMQQQQQNYRLGNPGNSNMNNMEGGGGFFNNQQHINAGGFNAGNGGIRYGSQGQFFGGNQMHPQFI